MKKKILSAITALALIAPTITAFSGIAVSAASEPEVTVVGKQITGDSNYFEISLEVNGDYEDYSAIGVVLQYDPTKIVPADSWEDEAPAADMTAAVSWATRRALPTYGVPEWTTHTALAYESNGTGYLYLGAEYPGKQPGVTASTTTDPATAATPDPDDPHAKPVVAARFMYKGDDEAARKAMMNAIDSMWTTTWDSNWQSNTILKIAPDSIAGSSPAQYGFAYYGADFTERAFMYTWPTAASSTTTTTRAAYTPPANGASIADADKLQAGDIEIVKAKGKSAKSGGLALSDVFAILFFDWDDSLIGTLTAGIGAKDMAKTVNDYVTESLVHPALRIDYSSRIANGDYKKRQYSYRGEYPYDKPNSSNPTVPGGPNTVTDGADYPLTNKLDYVFAGRDIDPELPFANGWVQVTTKDMDYSDTTKYPGHWPEVLPKKMSDTYTWAGLSGITTFGRRPELNTDGTLKNASDNIPTLSLYDFDNITSTDLQYGEGNLIVKAAYEDGEMLNGVVGVFYSTDKDVAYDVLNMSSKIYSISYNFRRVNTAGYGVTKVKDPTVRMDIQQTDAKSSSPMAVSVENNEVISVQMTPTGTVDQVGYSLIDVYNSNLILGAVSSSDNAITGSPFLRTTNNYDGFEEKALISYLIDAVKNDQSLVTYQLAQNMGLYGLNARGSRVVINSSATMTANNKNFMIQAVTDALAQGKEPTYYQIQWCILSKGTFLSDPATAKSSCQTAGYTWLKY